MVTGVVVALCWGKGIKIVNGHKKKCCCEGPAEGQFPYGHMMPAESSTALAPCNRLYELPTGPSGVWCTNGAVLNATMWPWDWELQLQGAGYSTAWEPKGRRPQKARQRCGRDSSPGLIIIGVPSVPLKTDTEAESKAQPLAMKCIILAQWLTCLFSMDLTIYVTLLLVNSFNAWGHLSPNWPLCPQMLLVSLSCCDAQVLKGIMYPRGCYMDEWSCAGYDCLCMLWSLGLQGDFIFLGE